jgi:hypothetical protein
MKTALRIISDILFLACIFGAVFFWFTPYWDAALLLVIASYYLSGLKS